MELAILLSTYNGMNYLEEQVSSLLAQTYTDWKLYIRDDASTDNTLALIHELAERDSRIIVMPSSRNLGAKEGFMPTITCFATMTTCGFRARWS